MSNYSENQQNSQNKANILTRKPQVVRTQADREAAAKAAKEAARNKYYSEVKSLVETNKALDKYEPILQAIHYFILPLCAVVAFGVMSLALNSSLETITGSALVASIVTAVTGALVEALKWFGGLSIVVALASSFYLDKEKMQDNNDGKAVYSLKDILILAIGCCIVGGAYWFSFVQNQKAIPHIVRYINSKKHPTSIINIDSVSASVGTSTYADQSANAKRMMANKRVTAGSEVLVNASESEAEFMKQKTIAMELTANKVKTDVNQQNAIIDNFAGYAKDFCGMEIWLELAALSIVCVIRRASYKDIDEETQDDEAEKLAALEKEKNEALAKTAFIEAECTRLQAERDDMIAKRIAAEQEADRIKHATLLEKADRERKEKEVLGRRIKELEEQRSQALMPVTHPTLPTIPQPSQNTTAPHRPPIGFRNYEGAVHEIVEITVKQPSTTVQQPSTSVQQLDANENPVEHCSTTVQQHLDKEVVQGDETNWKARIVQSWKREIKAIDETAKANNRRRFEELKESLAMIGYSIIEVNDMLILKDRKGIMHIATKSTAFETEGWDRKI